MNQNLENLLCHLLIQLFGRDFFSHLFFTILKS